MAVEDDFTIQLIPDMFNMVVLHHDDHHINLAEELIKVKDLVK